MSGTTPPPFAIPPFQRYWHNEAKGVAVLAASGVITLLSILFILVTRKLKVMKKWNSAHLFSHFMVLLFANSLQAFGTVLNFKWVLLGGVESGQYCSWQGALKQLANVSTAFFTATISLHLFALLFLRINLSTLIFSICMVITWAIVLLICAIGPTTIEEARLGPFFGVAGAWCWITEDYTKSRIFLEYMIEYIAALFCFILYTAILLRVRGNLYRNEGRWRLRNLNKEEAWQLSIGRDIIDSRMLKVAQSMVWYPVAFTCILIPISAARIPSFFGIEVPFAITIITAIIFNLSGFINVMLLLWTSKYIPVGDELPSFGTKRTHISVSLHKTGGLMPFTVDRSEQAEEYEKVRKHRLDRMGSQSSFGTDELSRSGTQSSYASTEPKGVAIPPPARPPLGRSFSQRSSDSRTGLLL